MVAGAVVIASCSTDTSTSSDTLTPTTTLLGDHVDDAWPLGHDGAIRCLDHRHDDDDRRDRPPAPSATTAPPAPSTEVAAAFVGGPEGDFWLPLGYWDGSAWVQTG